MAIIKEVISAHFITAESTLSGSFERLSFWFYEAGSAITRR